MSWWSNLFGFGRGPSTVAASRTRSRSSSQRHAGTRQQASWMQPELVSEAVEDDDEPLVIELEDAGPRRRFPAPLELPNLDAPHNRRIQLPPRLEDRLVMIGKRVRSGDLPVPGMSGASFEVVSQVDGLNVDIPHVVHLIEQDPVLSGEILKVANSVFFGGRTEVESVQLAVVRIGTRRLRDLVLSLSMRSTLFRYPNLSAYGAEIWRQASSLSSIARSLARPLGFDPERAQLLGLMKDVGKIPLLLMMRRDLGGDPKLDAALLSKIFFLYHERAGATMARAWNLSDEVCSVASCHHRFTLNGSHPRSGALVSLAHKADLWLSLGAREEFAHLITAAEFDELGVSEEARPELLAVARECYVTQHPETIAETQS